MWEVSLVSVTLLPPCLCTVQVSFQNPSECGVFSSPLRDRVCMMDSKDPQPDPQDKVCEGVSVSVSVCE